MVYPHIHIIVYSIQHLVYASVLVTHVLLFVSFVYILYKKNPVHSAYRSSLLVKTYKERGGTYKGKENKSSGLNRWFSENGLINVEGLDTKTNQMFIDQQLR